MLKDLKPMKVFQTLIRFDGSYEKTARALHTTIWKLEQCISDNPELEEQVGIVHNKLYESALSSAKDLVDMRNADMTKFVLKTIGAKRGWAEKSAVTLEGNPDKPLYKPLDLSGMTEAELLTLKNAAEKITVNKP